MGGVTNSATIGFQNGSGAHGTEIIYDSDFVDNELSWAAATVETDVPWMVISSDDGELNGMLNSGESDYINVQVLTSGLDPGSYEAAININSVEVEPVSVPVYVTVTGESASPTLPHIDISGTQSGIVTLPDNVDSLFMVLSLIHI